MCTTTLGKTPGPSRALHNLPLVLFALISCAPAAGLFAALSMLVSAGCMSELSALPVTFTRLLKAHSLPTITHSNAASSGPFHDRPKLKTSASHSLLQNTLRCSFMDFLAHGCTEHLFTVCFPCQIVSNRRGRTPFVFLQFPSA